MVNQNGVLVCTAASEHSFLSKNGGFVNLKRDYPSFLIFKRAFSYAIKKKKIILIFFFFIQQGVFDKLLNFHHQIR